MIIAERKPFPEIKEMLAPYQRVLVLGCGTCVAVCWAGGEKEVAELATQLRMALPEKTIHEGIVQRQCEIEMIREIKAKIGEIDAVLSLACGIGAQTMAQVYPDVPVLPGLNTSFLGMPEREGVWVEMCQACGECVLDKTGGICPKTRCAKGLLNGPCGGVRKGGKCESDPEKDCAWVLIYKQLDRQGKLAQIKKYNPPRNNRAVKRPGRITAEIS